MIDAATSGPDGIPGSADDADFTAEIFSGDGPEDTAESGYGDAYGGDRGLAGGSSARRGPAGDDSDVSENGFRNLQFYGFGCGSCLMLLLAAIFVLSLLGAVLGVVSPVLLPFLLIMAAVYLFTSGRGQ